MKRFVARLIDVFRACSNFDADGANRLWLFFDFIYCRLRYHITRAEYFRYQFYSFKENYRKNFFLIHHRKKLFLLNTKGFTSSKYLFSRRIPDCYSRDLILAPSCGEAAFVEFAKKHEKIIVKPDLGSCGRSIQLFVYSSDEQARQFFATITTDAVCEEFIRQHEALNTLNPFCVNSIRILSLLRDENVEILCAVLRTSSDPATFVDNVRQGGIYALVDIPTGIITSFGYDYSDRTHTVHPTTKQQFIGFNIPNWQEALDLVKKAHRALPECALLGWDIAITETGADIIEANNAPDPMGMQTIDHIPKGKSILALMKENKRKGRRKP